MIQRLRGQKGFTLIELMIVIAIIGILAAIAIPNFIAYRDKAFCSATESDANAVGVAIADYFSIPTHVAMITMADLPLVQLSGNPANVAVLGGTVNAITISVTDSSARCPVSYTGSVAGWAGSTFTKTM